MLPGLIHVLVELVVGVSSLILCEAQFLEHINLFHIFLIDLLDLFLLTKPLFSLFQAFLVDKVIYLSLFLMNITVLLEFIEHFLLEIVV